MKKRNVNTTQVLSPEDKSYLRKVSNYLNSLGMRDGSIELEIDNATDFDFNEIDWENDMSYFSNNYSAEVPPGLISILKKVADYIQQNDLFETPDQDDLNYERIEIDIDTNTKELSINHWWTFYGRGDGSSKNWDEEDGKEILEEWEKDGVLDGLTIPNDGILTIKYNGSGDSGYIESDFDETGDSVPSAIEDWCYRQLEQSYGGWEINEGSDGEFRFDFNNTTIDLDHTYNTEENASNTIYEESFAQ